MRDILLACFGAAYPFRHKHHKSVEFLPLITNIALCEYFPTKGVFSNEYANGVKQFCKYCY